MLFINAKRNGYSPEQCGHTMTVGELINMLSDFDENEKVYLTYDNKYTFGSITQWDFLDESNDESNDDCDD